MPTEVTNYKCPSCTGPLHFVGESGKLECDFCGSSFNVAEIDALYADKEKKAQQAYAEAAENRDEASWDMSGMSDDWGDDGKDMKAYNCPSCSAELICEATTAATSCPYCGNPTVVPGQFGGALKPDYVIPFKLNKQSAISALKTHYKGKIFLPRSFSDGNHIEEIKGIYVPFWLFDAQTDADCVFEATRSYSLTQGDYRITRTEHFDVRRAGTIAFERIPADASSKMPDDCMDSIEPFDYSELRDFSSAYLPGYLADKYDVSAEQSAERADLRCRNSALDIMEHDVNGYQTVTRKQSNVRLRRGQVRYALMPVWTLSTKWRETNYLFAMNGQTGKLVGDLPVSRLKFWGMFAALAAVSSTLFLLAGVGTWLAAMLLG